MDIDNLDLNFLLENEAPPVVPKYGVPGGGLFVPGDLNPNQSSNPLINNWWDVLNLNVGYWMWGDRDGDGVPDAPGTVPGGPGYLEIDPETGTWEDKVLWPWEVGRKPVFTPGPYWMG